MSSAVSSIPAPNCAALARSASSCSRTAGSATLAEQRADLVGELVDDLDEEVRAAARGVQDVEVKEPGGGRRRIVRGELADRGEMPIKRRADRAAHEMADELGARVVDAGALASPFMS